MPHQAKLLGLPAGGHCSCQSQPGRIFFAKAYPGLTADRAKHAQHEADRSLQMGRQRTAEQFTARRLAGQLRKAQQVGLKTLTH